MAPTYLAGSDFLTLSNIYMLVGFLLAGYSVIANDSVQTLGTFLSSNRERVKWYWLWAASATVLVVVLTTGWYLNNGDIAYGRLAKIPQPTEFYWYQAFAPAVLLLLTRFGLPVSTTFLTLSMFASSVVLEQMLMKSVIGYALAAISAYLFWLLLSRLFNEFKHVPPQQEKFWRVAQWCATGLLWSSWLTHDMANVAVYLPRQMSVPYLLLMLGVAVTALGWVFYTYGGAIQKVVMNKSGVRYVRSATLIDLFYAFLLFFFKEYNSIPMSTTWVFVGLLTGRELAIYRLHDAEKGITTIFPILLKDFFKIMLGLAASVGIVLMVMWLQGDHPG